MSTDNSPKETRVQRLQVFLVYLLCVLLLGAMGALWLRERGFFRASPVVEFTPDLKLEKPIDLNTAGWWELMQVRGIGETRAKEIVALRERKILDQKRKREKERGFQSLDELSEVPGITPAMIEELRSIVRVEQKTK
jgi:ERCC4-type nuclease